MRQNRSNKAVRKVVSVALAAVLLVSTVFAASATIRARLIRAEKPGQDVTEALSGTDVEARAVRDQSGKEFMLPEMIGAEVEPALVEKLVGEYVYDAEGTLTCGDYTVTLESVLIDAQGIGFLTCRLENPKGIPVQDTGYGQIELPIQLSVRSEENENSGFFDCRVYENGTENTENRRELAVFFGPFSKYRAGSPVYFSINEKGWSDTRQTVELMPEKTAPVVTLSDGKNEMGVSALGVRIQNPVSGEFVVRELILESEDGSEYAVTSEARNQANERIGCWQGDDGEYDAICYVFNRLVDAEELTAVRLEGDSEAGAICREYRR